MLIQCNPALRPPQDMPCVAAAMYAQHAPSPLMLESAIKCRCHNGNGPGRDTTKC